MASSGCGVSACLRAKASSRPVSAVARCTPCSAMSIARSMRAARHRRRQFSDLPADGVEAAEHEGQQIVEVVGDAAGELADRLHLLRLTQCCLEPSSLGHVAGADDDAARLGFAGGTAVATPRPRPRLHPFVAMVPPLRRHALMLPVDQRARLRVEDFVGRASDHLCARLAVERERRRIDLLEAEAVAVLDEHGVALGRVLEERRHQRFARGERRGALHDAAFERLVHLGERFPRLLGGGDVVGDADETGLLAGNRPPGLRFRAEPPPRPVGAAEAGLDRNQPRRGPRRPAA